jgi:hypothetical protein
MALSTSDSCVDEVEDEELEPEDASPEAVITSILYNSSLRRSGVKYFFIAVIPPSYY